MADIAMCVGATNVKGTKFICPLRDKCYRFTATKNDRWQSYLVEVPYNKKTKKCGHYWDNVLPYHP